MKRSVKFVQHSITFCISKILPNNFLIENINQNIYQVKYCTSDFFSSSISVILVRLMQHTEHFRSALFIGLGFKKVQLHISCPEKAQELCELPFITDRQTTNFVIWKDIQHLMIPSFNYCVDRKKTKMNQNKIFEYLQAKFRDDKRREEASVGEYGLYYQVGEIFK